MKFLTISTSTLFSVFFICSSVSITANSGMIAGQSSISTQVDDYVTLFKRKASSNKNKKKKTTKKKSSNRDKEKSNSKDKKKKTNKDNDKEEDEKRNTKKRKGSSCKDVICELVLEPCPKDCPQSCGYLDSPDPCCPLLGKPTCP